MVCDRDGFIGGRILGTALKKMLMHCSHFSDQQALMTIHLELYLCNVKLCDIFGQKNKINQEF